MLLDCSDDCSKEQLEPGLESGTHAVCSSTLWTLEVGKLPIALSSSRFQVTFLNIQLQIQF